MKKYLICLFSIFALIAQGQQQVPLDEKRHIDSLETVLQSSKPDSAKAMASFMLVEYWKFKDTTKSKAFLLKGKQLAGKSAYLHALSYFYEGQYYFNWNTGKAAAAFTKAQKALSAFHTPYAYSKQAAAWYNYALMNQAKGYDFITRIVLERVLPNAEKAGDKTMLAHFYTQLSTILMNNYQFAKARVFLFRGALILVLPAVHF